MPRTPVMVEKGTRLMHYQNGETLMP